LRTDLLRQVWGDLAAKETGDLLGLHAQHRLADELVIQRPKRRGGAEHQIGGVFHLHQAPVVGLPEHLTHRAAQPGIMIEDAVQLVRRQRVGELLGARPVIDPDEGIVEHGVADACRRQLPRQPAMAVAVELQPER
jgi:hypothetical protein